MPATVQISPEVRSILESSTIKGNALILPPGQLDRALYTAVDKVLSLSGGKWNRTQKAHLFAKDPRDALGLALQTGTVVDEKVKYQAFYTPTELAEQVVARAGVAGCSVLEPSAGDGALALACRRAGAATIECVELRHESAKRLSEQSFSVHEGDFLAIKPRPRYQRVMMNPPFTRNQDLQHVQHALGFLEEGGRLVAVIAGNLQRELLQNLLAQHDAEVEMLDPGAFKASGTAVNTALLVINK